jgi:hypothetical protein
MGGFFQSAVPAEIWSRFHPLFADFQAGWAIQRVEILIHYRHGESAATGLQPRLGSVATGLQQASLPFA